MSLAYATPVARPDSIAAQRTAASLWPAHAQRAAHKATQQTAILIVGDGGFVAIEALAAVDPEKPATLPEAQLAERAKRLFKGQRAQLIAFSVVLEA